MSGRSCENAGREAVRFGSVSERKCPREDETAKAAGKVVSGRKCPQAGGNCQSREESGVGA